jgi:hypothetical protein
VLHLLIGLRHASQGNRPGVRSSDAAPLGARLLATQDEIIYGARHAGVA